MNFLLLKGENVKLGLRIPTWTFDSLKPEVSQALPHHSTRSHSQSQSSSMSLIVWRLILGKCFGTSCWNELWPRKLLPDITYREIINYQFPLYAVCCRVFSHVFCENDNQLTKLTGDARLCIEMFRCCKKGEQARGKEMPKSSSCDCEEVKTNWSLLKQQICFWWMRRKMQQWNIFARPHQSYDENYANMFIIEQGKASAQTVN